MNQQVETISGLIERITFFGEESGFCVLKVKAKGHKDLVTLVGQLPTVTAGEWVEASGAWINNRQYGQQFKAEEIKLTAPATTEGVEKYLASGLIKGVGPFFAKKLVSTFGVDIFDIIEKNPEKLRKVPGIGESLIQKIIAGWGEQKSIRDIMVFLHSYGVSTTKAVRIYKTYGSDAIKLIRENPYQLAQDIRGIGFLSADQIARQLGIDKDSPLRARAGISHVLVEATQEGDCGTPLEKMILTCQKLLDIEEKGVRDALTLELDKGTIVQDSIEDTSCVFLRKLYAAEKAITEKLQILGKSKLPWPTIDLGKAIAWVEEENDIALSASQKLALEECLSHKVSIITGGPGVGKTTLLRSIIQILKTTGMSIALCAPTGRAAKRMTEATGLEAKTIHRLLSVNPITGLFFYTEDSPLRCDVLIVDETSMVDVPLMNALLKAIPSSAAVIFVGDKDQLPSVGPGQVLADLIASKTIPCIHLTETFRQAASSIIIKVAQDINMGIMPSLKGHGLTSDFFFLEASEPEQALTTIIDLIQNRLPRKFGYSPLHDIQVLSPMTKGLVGTRNLNTELQNALNPAPLNSIHKFGSRYSVGDKVIQIENNYEKEVYNGDIGTIQSIHMEDEKVSISFDGRYIDYTLNEMDEISLAYAMTIHKSQGSEYPVVIIPLFTQHYMMLRKNLIYTGITRGKKLVVVVGQEKALAMAVNNTAFTRRWSMLETHLVKSKV